MKQKAEQNELDTKIQVEGTQGLVENYVAALIKESAKESLIELKESANESLTEKLQKLEAEN